MLLPEALACGAPTLLHGKRTDGVTTLTAPNTQETLHPAAWYWTTGPHLTHRPNVDVVGTTNYPKFEPA